MFGSSCVVLGEGLSDCLLPPVSMRVSCVNFPFIRFLLGSDFLNQ